MDDCTHLHPQNLIQIQIPLEEFLFFPPYNYSSKLKTPKKKKNHKHGSKLDHEKCEK